MLALAAGSLLLGAAASPAPPPPSASIPWAPSFKAALEEAKRGDRIVMAFFWASWNRVSRGMEERTLAHPDVVAFARALACARVNYDFNRTLRTRYGVRVVPTVVFVDARGELCGKIEGAAPPAVFLRKAGEILRVARRFPAALRGLREKPGDPSLLYDVARGYQLRGDRRRARLHLRAILRLGGNGLEVWKARAHCVLGEIALEEMRPDTAVREFEQALQGARVADRGDLLPRALIQLAVCHLQLHQYERAAGRAEAYAKDFPKGPDRPQALFIAGFSLWQLGEDARAVRYLDEASRAGDGSIWAERARTLLRSRR